MLLQVYSICCQAIADCPCCPSALDTLAQYYLCLACLNLAQEKPQTQAAATPAAAEGRGDGEGREKDEGGGGKAALVERVRDEQPSSECVQRAKFAVRAGIAVLDKAMVANPMKGNYWAHRQDELSGLVKDR